MPARGHSRRMEDALNGQVNKEMYSAYLYMAMSSHMTSVGLNGFANWLMVQYHEEMLHAMKIYEFRFSPASGAATAIDSASAHRIICIDILSILRAGVMFPAPAPSPSLTVGGVTRGLCGILRVAILELGVV
ncbi:MAG: hypothetical protein GF331_26260 [Chitinivibrionales bacterium]|nr:hypothetical protein [Chitinivibrionales bacterium]